MVSASVLLDNTATARVTVDGIIIMRPRASSYVNPPVSFLVPAGSTYVISNIAGTTAIEHWAELR